MATVKRPTQLPRAAVLDAFRRVPRRFAALGLTDIAAALTYYAVFSIFPALLALVSVLSFAGDGATQPLLDSLEESPGTTGDLLKGVVETAAGHGGGLTFAIGLGAAIWAASGYVGAFGRASNTIFGVEEGRPFWKLRPVLLALTTALLLLAALASIASVLSGPIARELGDVAGVGEEAVRTWDRLKLPGILLVVWVLITLLMAVTPNVRLPGISWLLPGALVALLTLIATSTGLAFYFANFASYDKTYGTLAGVIAFLFWLWVSNIALLAGQLVNAELEYERERATATTGRDGAMAATPKQAKSV
ncbi:MAG: YihY/virulence factor BrkB family protein [Baekduia sp.]